MGAKKIDILLPVILLKHLKEQYTDCSLVEWEMVRTDTRDGMMFFRALLQTAQKEETYVYWKPSAAIQEAALMANTCAVVHEDAMGTALRWKDLCTCSDKKKCSCFREPMGKLGRYTKYNDPVEPELWHSTADCGPQM
jgi:hypothetical protein